MIKECNFKIEVSQHNEDDVEYWCGLCEDIKCPGEDKCILFQRCKV